MPFETFDKLTDMHIDALREIGNIGSGNAASALSTMLCCPVNISVPTVQVLDYNDAVEQMGGPEQMIVGSLISLEGDVQGMILFLLQKNFSSMMIKTLLCEEEAPDPGGSKHHGCFLSQCHRLPHRTDHRHVHTVAVY